MNESEFYTVHGLAIMAIWFPIFICVYVYLKLQYITDYFWAYIIVFVSFCFIAIGIAVIYILLNNPEYKKLAAKYYKNMGKIR